MWANVQFFVGEAEKLSGALLPGAEGYWPARRPGSSANSFSLH